MVHEARSSANRSFSPRRRPTTRSMSSRYVDATSPSPSPRHNWRRARSTHAPSAAYRVAASSKDIGGLIAVSASQRGEPSGETSRHLEAVPPATPCWRVALRVCPDVRHCFPQFASGPSRSVAALVGPWPMPASIDRSVSTAIAIRPLNPLGSRDSPRGTARPDCRQELRPGPRWHSFDRGRPISTAGPPPHSARPTRLPRSE